MGEGGAVATNAPELHRILLSLRDWGRDCWCPPGRDNTCRKRFDRQSGKLPFGYDHKYVYSHLGYNLKITDWQAALGLSQLNKLPSFLAKRKENAECLLSSLRDLSEWLLLPAIPPNLRPAWFGFMLSIKPGATFTKLQLVEYLEKHGIGTRQLFAGNVLRQAMFIDNDITLRIRGSRPLSSHNLTEAHFSLLPNTDFIMNNAFWVGTFPGLGASEMNKISQTIHAFVKERI
jgi:CDP-6-deoxy-D-xylo-4-hexulose-3-dehydrase